MKLGKDGFPINFPLVDFLESQTARRHNIREQFNPPKEVVENLKQLSINILQPLRNEIGAISISSGYRCPKVNEIIGGALNPPSQHTLGEASDNIPLKVSKRKMFDKVIEMNLPFDQLIAEYPDDNGEPAWIHISYTKRRKARKQILIIDNINGITRTFLYDKSKGLITKRYL